MSVDPVVLGFDLSLKHTGVAYATGNVSVYESPVDGTTHGGMARLDDICRYLEAVVDVTDDLELVIIEALAFDAHDTKREQAQLAGIVRHMLYRRDTPYLLVAPGTLKKYATGNGSAGKYEVIQAAERRLGYTGHDDNEADALWLRAIGWDLLDMPIVDLPKAHREILTTLRRTPPIRRTP